LKEVKMPKHLTLVKYHQPNGHSTPVTGRFLAHTHLDRVARAFVADDLYTGVKRLVEPTMLQAALLARVSPAYAWAARKRHAERGAIEMGLVPLVPPRLVRPKTNGHTLSIPAQAVEIDDSALIDFVHTVGVSRVLDAAVTVEAAQ
jgi:hypothetical protein